VKKIVKQHFHLPPNVVEEQKIRRKSFESIRKLKSFNALKHKHLEMSSKIEVYPKDIHVLRLYGMFCRAKIINFTGRKKPEGGRSLFLDCVAYDSIVSAIYEHEMIFPFKLQGDICRLTNLSDHVS